jgi:isochorismate hydrolase
MKRFFGLILFLMQMNAIYSRDKDSTALLIIDIQKFYFPGGSVPLENPEAAAENAALLLDHFRKRGNLVVHIGHVSKTGADFYPLVEPLPGEKVIMKKEVNAFLNTDLDDLLRKNNIKNLVYAECRLICALKLPPVRATTWDTGALSLMMPVPPGSLPSGKTSSKQQMFIIPPSPP